MRLFQVLALSTASHMLIGQSAIQQSDSLILLPQIEVLDKSMPLLTKTPGSAVYLPAKELQQLQAISGNEVMRRATGVHVVEEEGAGLRINVGIRGLNPDRSRNVLILEDGIPVALNPYGEPEMYYTPAIDRMQGVEILKGSGQILFGPQTIGGVINYVTAAPPKEATGLLRVRGGSGNYFSSYFQYGNTVGNSGFQIDFLHKRADNFGPTWFQLYDLNLKFQQQISNKTSMRVKVGFYDELSNSTYIGLTQTMYDSGGQDFVQMAPGDRLPVRRLSGSVHLTTRYNSRQSWHNTAFAYSTTRNWNRQDFSFDPNASNLSGAVWGDPNIPNGAVYMMQQTGARNRQFQVSGVESKYIHKTKDGKGEWILGSRFMHELGLEQSIRGTNPGFEGSDIRSRESRTGYATSGYSQYTHKFRRWFSAHAGMRAEHYRFERQIQRGNFGNGIVDTSVIGTDQTFALIPGIGFNMLPFKNINVFGGIHRGFAPPRVKDAITIGGMAQDLEAELSWNSEIGIRGQIGSNFQYEFTGFYMDFSNQIIPVSESSGGTGTGLVNGGSTLHSGVEAGGALTIPLAEKIGQITIDANYTFVHAVFNEDRFKTVSTPDGPELINLRGNRTPYAPQHLLSSAVTWQGTNGTFFRTTLTFSSKQFGDELNTVSPTPNGRIGQIDAWYLVDISGGYELNKLPLRFELSIRNLTDERFIMTRRPQGIRVALPRMVFAGVVFKF
jgi:Fe(3+) dicitrate transport protein